jgi:hypothetical protein
MFLDEPDPAGCNHFSREDLALLQLLQSTLCSIHIDREMQLYEVAYIYVNPWHLQLT